MVERLRSAVTGAVTVVSWLSSFVLLATMLLAASDVVMRNVFGQPIRGTVAFVEIGLVTLVFFAVAQVQRMGGHIAVDVVVTRLPTRLRRFVDLVTDVLMLAGIMVLAWATSSAAIRSTQRGERFTGLVDVPSWPARIVLAVGFVLLALQVAVDAGRRTRRAGER